MPPTSTDHENSGVRRRLMPGARSVSTVVTTETVATASATSRAMNATTKRSTASLSLPNGPPSRA